MRFKILFTRLVHGEVANVRFSDFRAVIEGFGFQFVRKTGSHHIFKHSGVQELVNVQEVGGEAKPYQIRQVLRIIERYNLTMKGKNG